LPIPASTAGPAPQVSEPDRIRIPRLALDLPLVLKVVAPVGEAPDPGPAEAFLYDLSALSGLGGLPGRGNTIIVAQGAGRTPPGRFAELPSLASGDDIQVTWQGRNYVYKVAALCTVARRNFGAITSTTQQETLTLVPSTPNDPILVVRAERNPGSTQGACPEGTTPARP
jgi:LPXTG-site transpeptidase (sortase) family protein